MRFGRGAALPFLFACASVTAQDVAPAAPGDSSPPQQMMPSEQPSAPQPCDCVVLPALMIVDIEIAADLSSATSKDGDTFPIRLASPVIVDGRVAVAAGATGLGEVIHAQKSGMGGGGGELLLAARYLEVDGRRLRLRSFRASSFGKNQTGAALATSYAFGVFGLAVKGKNTAVAAGSVAEAKIAEPFTLPLSALPPAAAASRDEPGPSGAGDSAATGTSSDLSQESI